MYTFPHDGYVVLSSEESTSGNIRVVIRASNDHNIAYMYMNVTDAYQIDSVFVKAGMKGFVFGRTDTINTSVRYVALA